MPDSIKQPEVYLGDGLYAEYNGYTIKIFSRTSGSFIKDQSGLINIFTHHVELPPETFENFAKFVAETMEKVRDKGESA